MPEDRMLFCPNCGSDLPEAARFCPTCGKDMKAPMSYIPTPPIKIDTKDHLETVSDIIRGLGGIASMGLVAFLGLNVAIMLWGIGEVLPNTQGDYTRLFLVTPWIVEIVRLWDEWFAAAFLLMVAAILISFVWMVYRSLGPMKVELRFDDVKEHSPAYVISTLFFALFFFNILFYLLVEFLGATPNSPDFENVELWTNLYGFVRASVWEELIVRVLYIGLPLLFIDVLLKNRNEKAYRYLLGGRFGIGRPEVVLILFSSFMFAIAHAFSWDLYKTIPTFLGGLAFGYLFLKYGLYASIMLHFAFDYISMPMDVFESDAVTIAIGLLILAWLGIGMAYFVSYSMKTFTFTRSLLGIERREKVDQVKKEPESYDPNFSRPCPYCGDNRARLLDGELECLNCGRRY